MRFEETRHKETILSTLDYAKPTNTRIAMPDYYSPPSFHESGLKWGHRPEIHHASWLKWAWLAIEYEGRGGAGMW